MRTLNIPHNVIIVNSPLSVENELGKMGVKAIFQREIGRAGNNFPTVVTKGPIFCTEDRINQPVLLPSGDLVLCCQDYGLKHAICNINDLNRLDDYFKLESYRAIVDNMGEWEGDILCRRCEKAALK